MDTISNLLTIIRNGYLAQKPVVLAPYSKFAKEILGILTKEGYLSGFKVADVNKIKRFEIQLKYEKGVPGISGITKVSKPGRRIYRRADRIPKSLSALGITIVSTSQGVMTDKDAKRKKLGGEVICQVW